MPLHPIAQLLKRRKFHVLGVNSGTSIDGLDFALVEVSETSNTPGIRLLQTRSFSIPRTFRTTLYELAAATQVDKETVTRAHYRLGELIAASVTRFRNDLPRRFRIDLIGSHGQTIGHFPDARRRQSATWQIIARRQKGPRV